MVKTLLKLIFLYTPIIGLLLFILMQSKDQKSISSVMNEKETILPVQVLAIKKEDSYEVERRFTGRLEAFQTVELGFENRGKLTFVGANEGDIVQKGTLLAKLDYSLLEISAQEISSQEIAAKARLKEMVNGPRKETIAVAKSICSELEEQLKLAQKKCERTEYLVQKGNVAHEEHDENLSNLQVLEARVNAAKKKLEELEAGTRQEKIEEQKALITTLQIQQKNLKAQIQQSILKAPFTGVISYKKAELGQVIQPGEILLKILNTTKLKAKIGLPILLANKLEQDETYQLEIEQQQHPTKIFSLLPELNSNTQMITVIFLLEPKNHSIYPGQLVSFPIKEIKKEAGFWFPITSLLKGNYGLWSCFVLKNSKANFHIEKKDLEILFVEGDRVFATGAFQPNEKIVKSGVHRIVPFQKVRITSSIELNTKEKN